MTTTKPIAICISIGLILLSACAPPTDTSSEATAIPELSRAKILHNESLGFGRKITILCVDGVQYVFAGAPNGSGLSPHVQNAPDRGLRIRACE